MKAVARSASRTILLEGSFWNTGFPGAPNSAETEIDVLARCPVSKIDDIMATRSFGADPHKQQIPPLRCAPVGMTNYSIISETDQYVG